MKITYSPLVASASGTTANAVAASWKGINYIRMHVIPHNPKTDAQQAVRDALTRCVTLWRSLSTEIKFWLNSYGVDYRMSGFNIFMKYCRTLEQAAGVLKPVPDSPYEAAPSTFAAVEGVGAGGDIDLTWVDNSSGPFQKIMLLTRLKTSSVFAAMLVPTAGDESFTITGLSAGGIYDVYGAFYDHNNNLFGTSVGVQSVTAKA